MLATSYSLTDSFKHNLGIWGSVMRFGKVGLLRFYHVVDIVVVVAVDHAVSVVGLVVVD